jgi:AcrR family transcriptional regulator
MIETTTKPKSRLKKPSQARSVATFANILSAATEVIVERGIGGLNTNIVAERASVNIGTVYHYFPDKAAILVELFRLDQQQRSAYLLEKLSELPTAPDLAEWSHELFSLVRRLRYEHPTTAVMRRAFQSVPELVEIDNTDTADTANYVARLLRERFATLDDERARFAARLLVETTMTIMDSELAEGPQSGAFFDEALHLINTYLETIDQ